jgi:hypothetical protein
VLVLAALPVLAASALSAPAAQSLQPVSYLPLVTRSSVYARIAFASYRDGNYEIYMMNADGSGQSPLTDYTSDIDPTWSPPLNAGAGSGE